MNGVQADAAMAMKYLAAKGIANPFEGLPEKKRPFIEAAYRVVCAANDFVAALGKADEYEGDAKVWWKAWNADRVISAVAGIKEAFAFSSESGAMEAVERVSRWLGDKGWECLRTPLSEVMKVADAAHDIGVELKNQKKGVKK